MLDAKHNQIRSAHHGPVPGLVGIFVVALGRLFTYFNFVIVVPEGFFIIPELRRDIGQNPNMCAVVAAVFPLAAAYDGGYKLVKFPVPPNQELDILMFPKQSSYELFQPVLYFQRIANHAMPKEGNCKHFHILLLQIHKC